jgi:hypothetical protein
MLLQTLTALQGHVKENSQTSRIFATLKSVIFWLFMFLLKVKHSSSRKNTSFHIIFLSPIEPVTEKFSILLLTWIFLQKFWQNFFHDSYFAKVLQMNILCSTAGAHPTGGGLQAGSPPPKPKLKKYIFFYILLHQMFYVIYPSAEISH